MRDSEWASLPLALTGGACTVAVLMGLRRNHPSHRRPWIALAACSGLFIASSMLRYALAGTDAAPLAELFAIAGYVALVAGFMAFLRPPGAAGLSRDEIVDGLVVIASAASIVVVVFTVPTARHAGHLSASALLGLYPFADVVISFLLLVLLWTSARRVASYWLLAASMSALLVGDVGYAVVARQGRLIGSPLLDLPYILAFGCLAAAALHPSMAEFSVVERMPLRAWSRGRLALLAPALLAPSGILILGGSRATTLTAAAGGAAVILLLLVRAVGAVRVHGQSQDMLRFQAAHDPLTGLANRTNLVEELRNLLKIAAASGGHVDALVMDLDEFKIINDSWGHGAGDRILEGTALRLREASRPGVLLARTGGDEFILALPVSRNDRDDGQALATRILASFRKPSADPNGSHGTTISIGIARSTPGVRAEGLLHDADTAMYRAKAAGRNRFVLFDESMRAALRFRSETVLALRDAIAGGQLCLEYQPIVRLDDERTVAVEALLRWDHPTRGRVSPATFIPLAEQTGLIVAIGTWVLDAACAQAAAWTTLGRYGTAMQVAVNVSARQLAEGSSFVELVKDALARHGLGPASLLLEVTESALMEDAEAAVLVLAGLKELGVMIAIDDFGTGYSSLSYLQRFPVDHLKIDMSFVARLDQRTENDVIVRSVIELTRAFGIEAVAEGVETREQLAALRRLGCVFGQGFLWSRSLSPADLEMYVTTSRPIAAHPATVPHAIRSAATT